MDRRVTSIQRFVELVALELGGTALSQERRIALRLTSGESIAIDPTATAANGEVSRERLLYVEQQAAIALLAAPIYFGAEVADRSRRQKLVTVLRAAFGYRLTNGRPCLRRYTSYFEPTSGQRGTIRGDDELFAALTVEVRPDTSFIHQHLAGMALQIRQAFDDYWKDAELNMELEAIGERQRSELFELDLLYNRRSQRYLRTYGVDPEAPEKKPSSPTEEFNRKRRIVVHRHAPTISVEILSLGTVVTAVGEGSGFIQLPFLQSIPTERLVSPAP
jgi:hypothetical protein